MKTPVAPGRNAATHSERNPATLVLLGCLVAYAVLAITFWWVGDDAYISFRFSRNFAEGLGLRYNIGPDTPVEGFSNPLWVLIGAVFEYCSLPPDFFLPLLSLLCGLYLIERLWSVNEHVFFLSPLRNLLALSLTALAPPMIIWASSGLETMPFVLALFLAYEALFIDSRRNSSGLTGAVIAGSVCLLRPEGLGWIVILVCIGAILSPVQRQVYWSQVRWMLLGVLFLLGGYVTFRLQYYGQLLPNTAYAKVGMSGASLWRGFCYVTSFCLTFVSPVILLCCLPNVIRPSCWRKARGKLLLSSTALVLGFLLYACLVGGDYMAMGRFLVPVFPFLSLSMAAYFTSLDEGGSQLLRGGVFAVTLLALFCSILPLVNVHVVPESIRRQFHFRWNRTAFLSEIEQWRFMRRNSGSWKQRGLALVSYASPTMSLIAPTIGNVGYYSRLFIYDSFGLVTPLVTSLPSPKHLNSAGHDKKASPNFLIHHYQPDIAASYLLADKNLHAKVLKRAQRLEREIHSKLYAPDFRVFFHRETGEPRVLLVARRYHSLEQAEKARASLALRMEVLKEHNYLRGKYHLS